MGENSITELVTELLSKFNFRFFTIIASKLIKHKTKYHVSISAQGYDTPPTLEVAIRNSKKDGKIFEVANNISLINGKTQTIEFDVKTFNNFLKLRIVKLFILFTAERSANRRL